MQSHSDTTAKKRQRAGSLHNFINEGAQELATTKMEDLIQLEISDMIKAITNQAGVPFDFQKLVVHTASHILGQHFFGERWSTQRNSQLRYSCAFNDVTVPKTDESVIHIYCRQMIYEYTCWFISKTTPQTFAKWISEPFINFSTDSNGWSVFSG